jgi:hypothetical protein
LTGALFKTFEDKMKSLKAATKDLYERVKEAEERPRAIEALNSVMNYSQFFLVGMMNFTGKDQPFTQVEMETLSKLIVETQVQHSSFFPSLVFMISF